MSLIETVNDVDNTFLSRRELVCNFTGLAGKLKKVEAVDMITKEFKLDGKVVIPILLQNQVGKSIVKGTFYVYEDENLAKKHVNPTIFKRLEKAKTKDAESQAAEAEQPTEVKTESAEASTESSEEEKEVKSEEKEPAPEEKTEEKSE